MSSSPHPQVSLEQQAIEKVKSAFAELADGNQLFQQCIKEANSVAYLVSCVEEQCKKKKRKASSRLLKQIQDKVELLEALSAMVDGAVQAQNTTTFCSMWAPLTFVLRTAKLHNKLAKQITILIETISKLFPRLKIYQALLPHSDLQAALFDVFADIVLFCLEAYRFFKRSILVQLWKFCIRPVRKSLQEIIDHLSLDIKNVDKTANAVDAERNAALRREQEKKLQEQERRDLEQQRINIQTWLGAPNMKTVHDARSRAKLEGTCEWILSQSTFESWLASQNTTAEERLLCVSGKSGCGKSTVASSIVEFLEKQGERILFFSFSGTEEHRQQIDKLVRSFISQNLDKASDGPWLDTLQKLRLNGQPTTSDLWGALQQIIATWTAPIYWLIDGLDECRDPIDELLDSLQQILNFSTTSKVMLFGRPHAFAELKTPPTCLIEVDNHMLQPDLEVFIEERIKKSRILEQSELRNMVQKDLLEKSDGMFLWVKLVIDNLLTASSDYEVKETLGLMPRGLQATYQWILQRLADKLGDFEVRMARHILGFIITSGRTLTIEELEYAQALAFWLESAQGTLKDYRLLDPIAKFLRVCESLINIQDGYVSLVHVTAKEYLISPIASWKSNRHPNSIDFRIDPTVLHGLFCNICLEHLIDNHTKSSQSSEIDDSPVSKPQPFTPYAIKYISYHINRAGELNTEILERLRRLVETQAFVSWLEAFLTSVEDDGYADGSFTEFDDLIGRIIGETSDLDVMEILASSLRQERERRRKVFGEQDWRTKSLQFLTTFYPENEDSSHEEVLDFNVTPSSEGDPREDNAGVRQTDVTFRPSNISEIVHFLRENDVVPRLRQADIFLIFASPVIRRLRSFIDPLDILFQMIIKSVATIPAIFLYGLGNFYRQQKKYQNALKLYQAALAKLGADDTRIKFELWQEIGNCYFRLKKYKDAITAYTAAEQGNCDIPMKFSLWQDIGHCYFRLKKYEDAITAYTAAEQGNCNIPMKFSLWQDIGHCYFRLKKYEDAITAYTAAEQGNCDIPMKFSLWQSIGTCYFNLEKYEDAITAYTTAKQGNCDIPMKFSLWQSIGFCYFKLEKYEDAITAYATAVQGNCDIPMKFSLWRIIGTCYFNLEKYEDAITAYTTAEQGNCDIPMKFSLWQSIGTCYFKLEKYEDAITAYTTAERGRRDLLGPDHKDTAYSVYKAGTALHKAHKYEDAERMLREAADIWEKIGGSNHKARAWSLQWLGCTLYHRGEYVLSEEASRQAISIAETNPDLDEEWSAYPLYYVGVALLKQEKYTEAERFFYKAGPRLKVDKILGNLPGTDSVYKTGEALFEQGEYNPAERMYRLAAVMYQNHLGLGHDKTANALYFTGKALLEQKKHLDAEDMFHQAASAWKGMPGYDGDYALISHHWIGRSLYRRKAFAEAEKIFQQVTKAMEAKHGTEYEETLCNIWWVAWALRVQGKDSEFEEMIGRLLPSMERESGLQNYTIFLVAFYSSVGLRKQNKFLDAEKILRRVLIVRWHGDNSHHYDDSIVSDGFSNGGGEDSDDSNNDDDEDNDEGSDEDKDDDEGDDELDEDGIIILQMRHVLREYRQIIQGLRQKGHDAEAKKASKFLASLNYKLS